MATMPNLTPAKESCGSVRPMLGGYWWQVLSLAGRESRDELREHAKIAVLTIIATLLLGGKGGQLSGGLEGALIGAVGAPLLIGFGLYLWKLAQAPKLIYREQAARISA